jgi:hypothetical protein
MFHPRRQAAGRPDWVQEIKHDGYRLIVRRDGEMVRLFTRRGYDWTDRYPAITRAAATLRAKSFTIDGEAAVCGPDGIAVFDSLHRRHKATDALLFGFDLLELDGEDLRPRPLGERKARLAKLQGDRDRVQRAHPRGRRDRVPARLQARTCRFDGLDQGQAPGQPGNGPTLTPADAPLIDAEKLFRQPGPAHLATRMLYFLLTFGDAIRPPVEPSSLKRRRCSVPA